MVTNLRSFRDRPATGVFSALPVPSGSRGSRRSNLELEALREIVPANDPVLDELVLRLERRLGELSEQTA